MACCWQGPTAGGCVCGTCGNRQERLTWTTRLCQSRTHLCHTQVQRRMRLSMPWTCIPRRCLWAWPMASVRCTICGSGQSLCTRGAGTRQASRTCGSIRLAPQSCVRRVMDCPTVWICRHGRCKSILAGIRSERRPSSAMRGGARSCWVMAHMHCTISKSGQEAPWVVWVEYGTGGGSGSGSGNGYGYGYGYGIGSRGTRPAHR